MNLEDSKPLLIFAHRGEASAFLTGKRSKQISQSHPHLYEQENYFLLVTGEGWSNALIHTASVIGYLGSRVSNLINIGLAGALTDEVAIGTICEVRTCYAYMDGGPVFHSYNSHTQDATIDCISAGKRIFDRHEAEQLLPFAQLVDREAWAIGAVATDHKFPFYAIKLVSDQVARGVDCAKIIADAPELSQLLRDYFLNSSLVISPAVANETERYPLPEGVYATTAMRREYENLMRNLLAASDKTADEILTEIVAKIPNETGMTSKQRMRHLNEILHTELNPIEAVVRQRVDSELDGLRQTGCAVVTDPHFETDDLKLSTTIRSEADLRQLIIELGRLDFGKIKKIMRGQLLNGKTGDAEKP